MADDKSTIVSTAKNVKGVQLLQAEYGSLYTIINNINELNAKRLKAIKEEAKATSVLTAEKILAERGLSKTEEERKKLLKEVAEETKGLAKTISDVATEYVKTSNKQEHFLNKSLNKWDVLGAVVNKVLSKTKDWLGIQMNTLPTVLSLVSAFYTTWSILSASIAASVGVLSTLVDVTKNLALAILSLPLKVFEGLQVIAEELEDLFQRTAEGLQNIVGTFGRLDKGVSASTRQMGLSVSRLGKTLSEFMVLGYAPERLEYWNNLIKETGKAAIFLDEAIAKNQGAFLLFAKGLGIGGDALDVLHTRSLTARESILDTTKIFMVQAQRMSKRFGVNIKQTGKFMADMAKNFTKFGSRSTDELAEVAIYAQKLKLEVEDLTSVLDKFANFEDAATNASKLAQAFGVNVDVMKMVQSQNPAESIDELRRAFFATGQAVGSMTHQQRSLLEDLTGLKGGSLDAAFALDKMHMSYRDIQKGSDEAKKSQRSQVEVLEDLVKSVQKLVFTAGKGGFLSRLFTGFVDGIKHSGDFYNKMMDLIGALRETYWAGRLLGDYFVRMFPGVKKMIDAFDVDGIIKKIRSGKKLIIKYFKDLSDPNIKDSPIELFENLVLSLKNTWAGSIFDPSSDAFKKLSEGFVVFARAVSKQLGVALKMALETLTSFFVEVGKFFKNPMQYIGSNAGAAKSFASELLNPIIVAIQEAGPGLYDAVYEAGYTLVGYVADALYDVFADNILWIVGGIGAVFATTGLFNFLGAAIGQWILTGSGGLLKSIGDAFGGMFQGGAGAGSTGNTMGNVLSAKDWWQSFIIQMQQMAIVLAGVLIASIAVAGTIRAILWILEGIDSERVVLALGVIATTAVALAATAKSLQLLSTINMNAGSAVNITIGLGVMALIMAGIVGIVSLLAVALPLFSNVKVSDITKFTTVSGLIIGITAAIGTMSVVLGAIAGTGIGTLGILGGLALIGLIVAGFTTTVIVVGQSVKEFLSQVNIGEIEKYKTLSETVINILLGVAKLAGSLTFSGGGFTGVNKIIDKFFLGENSIFSKLQLLMISLQETADKIADPSKVRLVAESMSSLMSAIANILEAASKLKSIKAGWISNDEDASTIVLVIEQINLLMDKVSSQMKSFITVARTLDSESRKSIAVLGSFMTGLGKLSWGLMSGFAAFANSESETKIKELQGYVAAIFGEENGALGSTLAVLTRFIKNTLSSIQGNLVSRNQIDFVVSSIGGIGDMVTQIIPAIESLKEETVSSYLWGLVETTEKKLSEKMPQLEKMFSSITTTISIVINGIIQSIKGAKENEISTKKLNYVSNIIKSVSVFTSAFTDLAKLHAVDNRILIRRFANNFQNDVDLLIDKGKKNSISNSIEKLADFYEGAAVQKVEKATAKLKIVNEVLKEFGEGMGSANKEINKDIAPELNKAMGLLQQEKDEIINNGKFTINLNVNVKLDAEKVAAGVAGPLADDYGFTRHTR